MPGKVDREAVFHPEFRQDLRYWVETDRKVALRAFIALSGMKPLGEKLKELGELNLTEPVRSLGVLADYFVGRVQREVRPERVTRAHEELSPLFGVLFITSNPIPVKAALELVGRPAGPPRLPLVTATQDERDRIRKILEESSLL